MTIFLVRVKGSSKSWRFYFAGLEAFCFCDRGWRLGPTAESVNVKLSLRKGCNAEYGPFRVRSTLAPRELRGAAGRHRDRPPLGVAVFQAASLDRFPDRWLAADSLTRRTPSVL